MSAVHAGNRLSHDRPATAGVVVNFIAFQIGWFACVLSAARGLPWAGTAVAAAIVGVHVARGARPRAELKLIGIALLIGVMWDSLLLTLGWLDFASGVAIDGVAPPWILALWALFAMTLNGSLGWLKRRPGVAALLGAVAGPLAYWGGAKLGAVVLVAPVPALIALSVGWAVFTPLLALLARRFDDTSKAD